MWSLEEASKFLEREKILEIGSEQLEQCRTICMLLDGESEIELRKEPFSPSKRVEAVPEIKEGELCLISVKRRPNETEFQRSLIGKPPALKANMESAYARGDKCFYDNASSKAFATLLRRYRILNPENGSAMRNLTIPDLKSAFEGMLREHAEFNANDEKVLVLVKLDHRFYRLASAKALADPEYCVSLIEANEALKPKFLPKEVRSSWRFAKALFESKTNFPLEDVELHPKINEAVLYGLSHEEASPGTLASVLRYFSSREEMLEKLDGLPKPPFDLR